MLVRKPVTDEEVCRPVSLAGVDSWRSQPVC
jgi:hypothetical protein